MNVSAHEVDVSEYSYLEIYEATFKAWIKTFYSDGSLFSDGYVSLKDFESQDEWKVAVEDFNWGMLRCLSDMNLADVNVQRFLRTAWDECSRFSGKFDPDLHGTCVGWAVAHAVARGDLPDWNELAEEVLDNERRRTARLEYERDHPEAVDERLLNLLQQDGRDRASAEAELAKINTIVQDALAPRRSLH